VKSAIDFCILEHNMSNELVYCAKRPFRMSSTEKLIKQLNKNKEIRTLQEKVVKPAILIQQVKNNLIILAHDLLVSKKINDSLYRKIQY
jgi:hypothetical protein